MIGRHNAKRALEVVRDNLPDLPLLSSQLIIEALKTKSGDAPELPGMMVAELLHRCWLFPHSEFSKTGFDGELEGYFNGSVFFQQASRWFKDQAVKRTYFPPEDLKNLAKTEIEFEAFHCLKSNLCKWDRADGVIAFVQDDNEFNANSEEYPPLEDTLLPFRLTRENYHESGVDFGRKDAFYACRLNCPQNKRYTIMYDDAYSLYFETLTYRIPDWLTGKSGALAIWFALHMKIEERSCGALDVGLSGVLSPETDIIERDKNPETSIRYKKRLFEYAGVNTIILPDVCREITSGRLAYWPHSEPVGARMNDLVNRHIERLSDLNEGSREFEQSKY